ncbi:MAG: hypothetical protein ABI541_09680, partial [Betaproteobacteria bacterium]
MLEIHSVPELRLREPQQARRFDRALPALARRFQRRRRGSYSRFQLALPNLDQCEAVSRLRLEGGRPGAIRQLDHRIRIRAGALEVSLGDEAFCAKIEQIEPVFDAQAGRCQRCARLLDRLLVVASPRQIAYALLDWAGSIR